MMTPYLRMPVAVFPEYVTFETEPLVAEFTVLMRRAWSLKERG